jgi:hypothetical protein
MRTKSTLTDSVINLQNAQYIVQNVWSVKKYYTNSVKFLYTGWHGSCAIKLHYSVDSVNTWCYRGNCSQAYR